MSKQRTSYIHACQTEGKWTIWAQRNALNESISHMRAYMDLVTNRILLMKIDEDRVRWNCSSITEWEAIKSVFMLSSPVLWELILCIVWVMIFTFRNNIASHWAPTLQMNYSSNELEIDIVLAPVPYKQSRQNWTKIEWKLRNAWLGISLIEFQLQ